MQGGVEQISIGGQYLQVKRAFINPSASGDTTIVSAVSGKAIRLIFAAIVSTLANAVHFRSNTTAISATWPFAANGGLVLPDNPDGWCQTAAGEVLAINMSVATATGIQVGYVEFPTVFP